jgi:hypothetical protein
VPAGGQRGDGGGDRLPGIGALEADDIEVVGAALGVEEHGIGKLAGQCGLAHALGTVEHGLLGADDGSPAQGEDGLPRGGGSRGSGGIHVGVWFRERVNAGGWNRVSRGCLRPCGLSIAVGIGGTGRLGVLDLRGQKKSGLFGNGLGRRLPSRLGLAGFLGDLLVVLGSEDHLAGLGRHNSLDHRGHGFPALGREPPETLHQRPGQVDREGGLVGMALARHV